MVSIILGKMKSKLDFDVSNSFFKTYYSNISLKLFGLNYSRV